VALGSTVDDAASGIDHVAYEYRPSGGSTWTATPAAWDTTALADGDYDLRVTAFDAAGNSTTSAPVTGVHVDNTAPTIHITAPGAYVDAQAADPFTVAVQSDATDITSVDLYSCSNGSVDCATG